MTRTRAQRLLLTMIALLCLRFGFLRPRLERRKKPCADEARLEARRLSAEARRHVRDRFRSRVIGDVIGAFVVTYGAGYLVWLLGHPGQTDAQMFEPYQWVPDIRPHLDGLVTPETARNWIGIALAASVSISITLSMRNKGSESYIEQAAMALWRQCMDAMTSALACACVVVMTVGWLGVHDKSDVGAMVLAFVALVALANGLLGALETAGIAGARLAAADGIGHFVRPGPGVVASVEALAAFLHPGVLPEQREVVRPL